MHQIPTEMRQILLKGCSVEIEVCASNKKVWTVVVRLQHQELELSYHLARLLEGRMSIKVCRREFLNAMNNLSRNKTYHKASSLTIRPKLTLKNKSNNFRLYCKEQVKL